MRTTTLERIPYRSSSSDLVRNLIQKVGADPVIQRNNFECVSVSWQDMHRYDNSSMGNNIVDATITETDSNQSVIMLRKPNYLDDSHLLLSSELELPLPSGKVVTLEYLLGNFGKLMKEENLWKDLPEDLTLSKKTHINDMIKPIGVHRFTGDVHYKKDLNGDVLIWPYTISPTELFYDQTYIPSAMYALLHPSRVPKLSSLALMAAAKDVLPKVRELFDREGRRGNNVTESQIIDLISAFTPSYPRKIIENGLIVLFDKLNTFSDRLKDGQYHIRLENRDKKGHTNDTPSTTGVTGVKDSRYSTFRSNNGSTIHIEGQEFPSFIPTTENVTRRCMCAWLMLRGRTEVSFTSALYTYTSPVLAILVYKDEEGRPHSNFRYMPANKKTRISIIKKAPSNGWRLKALKGTARADALHTSKKPRTREEQMKVDEDSEMACVTVYQIPLGGNSVSRPLTMVSEGLGGMGLGGMGLGGMGLGGMGLAFMDEDEGGPRYRSLGAGDIGDYSTDARISEGSDLNENIIYDNRDLQRQHGANITVTEIFYAVSEGVPGEESIRNRAEFLQEKYSKHKTESIFNLQNVILELKTIFELKTKLDTKDMEL